MKNQKWKKRISVLLFVSIIGISISPLNLVYVYAQEGDVVTANVEAVAESAVTTNTPPLVVETTTSNSQLSEEVLPLSTEEVVISVDASPETLQIDLSGIENSNETNNSSTQVFPGFISTSTTTLGSTTFGTSTEDIVSSSTSTEVVGGISQTGEAVLYDSDSEEIIDEEETVLPSGTTTIETGDSVALANILNIANTNLINSTGSIILANMFEGYDGGIDLREGNTSGSTTCTLVACQGIDSITANIDADAIIDNDVAVVATAGGNTVETAENAVIRTGNTIAGLNLVNVANTNIIDSSYFLMALNSFNSINGDIVLPSLSNLFSRSHKGGNQLDDVSIHTDGTITNNLDVEANAGNNRTLDSFNGTTHTGNSTTATNVYNNINSTLIGGNSVSLFLKVTGTWIGELLGLPFGSAFVQDGNNRILHYEDGLLQTSQNVALTDINSTTTASITNDVQVEANGGDNQTKDTQTSLIETGEALAAANIINIANSNIIGRNWMLAIINIFGDFNGNIAFGKPDLWLGEQVAASAGTIQNDSVLTYTITVRNNGDSNASNVNVSSSYDTNFLTNITSGVHFTESNRGTLIFSLGDISPNETKEIVFMATIKNATPGTTITNTSTASSREPDNRLTDNTDTTTITTTGAQTATQGGSSSYTITPIILISQQTIRPLMSVASISSDVISVVRQTTHTNIIGSGVKKEQSIIIKNLTNYKIKDVTFDDSLYFQDGQKIQTEVFDLGDILPNEEITIQYDIMFGRLANEGVYTLTSELHQMGRPSVLYAANGTIKYTKDEFGVGGDSDTTMEKVVGLNSTATPLLSYGKKTAIPRSTITRKEAVLGAFVESITPQTAYADSGNNARSTQAGVQYSLATLFLFLLVSLVRMYHRHIHG